MLINLPAVNHRLKPAEVAYILAHSDAELIIVDQELVPLLDVYKSKNPHVPYIIDIDTDEPRGQFNDAILEGLACDVETGGKGWNGLESEVADEDAVLALAYTSGTTARPKGVELTHRGCYLAALANVIESGLNYHADRCRFLWTLPMFHATGSFSTSLQPEIADMVMIRLDIPLGCDSCSGDALLPAKD
jgi:long-subunit acyl-CoA synthetase (AMP-forming)